MRHIGQIKNEANARLFGDYLVANGVHNEIERERDGSWTVWIRDEDQVADAQARMQRFLSDPNQSEFQRAAAEAEQVRKAQAEDLARYQRRVRTGRSLFPRMGGYGIGLLTYLLIVICIIVAVYSQLGSNDELLNHLFISDPTFGRGAFLPEVRAGQVWRLLTPIFIHFGAIHILFNMLWLYQLGCMIEGRQSPLHLLGLVVVFGAVSNVTQYLTGSITFGGMSGVVYALAGYAWIRGKYDRASGLGLDQRSVMILLIWLVICYTDLVGPVANAAHVSGLVGGVVWGRLSAWLAGRRPR